MIIRLWHFVGSWNSNIISMKGKKQLKLFYVGPWSFPWGFTKITGDDFWAIGTTLLYNKCFKGIPVCQTILNSMWEFVITRLGYAS